MSFQLWWFLFTNIFKNLAKGDIDEAWDSWCWLSFTVTLAIQGRVKRIK